MNVESVVKHCLKKDKESGKPWCLYDSKGEKLLGRHPSKEKAMNQEKAIHAKSAGKEYGPGIPDDSGAYYEKEIQPIKDTPVADVKESNEKVAVSPPGWSGTVEKMKEHKDIDNPYALAWWMSKQKPGAKWGPGGKLKKKPKPHYKPKKEKSKKSFVNYEKIIDDVKRNFIN